MNTTDNTYNDSEQPSKTPSKDDIKDMFERWNKGEIIDNIAQDYHLTGQQTVDYLDGYVADHKKK